MKINLRVCGLNKKTVKTVVPVPGETIDFIVFEMSTQNADISVILILKQLNSIFASKESKIFLYSEGFMSLTQNSQGTEESINVNRLWISGAPQLSTVSLKSTNRVFVLSQKELKELVTFPSQYNLV